MTSLFAILKSQAHNLKYQLAELLVRIKPVAPFVLEIADQLMLNSDHFLAIMYDGERKLTLRAVDGQMGRQGVVLTFTGDSGVKLSTQYFADVSLNFFERRLLRREMFEWVDYAEYGQFVNANPLSYTLSTAV